MRRRGHGAVTEKEGALLCGLGPFPRQLIDTWLTSFSVLIIIIS